MKYEYKNTGIEWLGEIPEHWRHDRIKDVSRLRDDKISIKSEELNYLELEDIEQGTGKILGYRNTSEVASAVIKFKKGDVLFGKLRPYLEKYYFADMDGLCTGEILAIEPKRIFGKFLNYYVGSPNFIKQCNVLAYGTKMPRVNWNTQISTFSIPLPPLPEQKAIADYLDKACNRIDNIIEIKQKQLEKIEGYFSSKIKEIITTGIDKEIPKKESGFDWFKEIPKHWKVVRLKSVLSKINSGVTPKGGSTIYVDEGIPLIRSQNIRFDRLDLSEAVCITKEIHNVMSNSKLLKGDVLLNITGASLGRCFYYDSSDEANVNQHVCILRPFQFIRTKFLYYLIRSEIGQAQIFSGFTGSGREGLSFESIKRFRIPLPPKSEQEEIEEQLDSLNQKIQALNDKINNQITTLQTYRKSLIHECVTGKKQVFEGELMC